MHLRYHDNISSNIFYCTKNSTGSTWNTSHSSSAKKHQRKIYWNLQLGQLILVKENLKLNRNPHAAKNANYSSCNTTAIHDSPLNVYKCQVVYGCKSFDKILQVLPIFMIVNRRMADLCSRSRKVENVPYHNGYAISHHRNNCAGMQDICTKIRLYNRQFGS